MEELNKRIEVSEKNKEELRTLIQEGKIPCNIHPIMKEILEEVKELKERIIILEERTMGTC